MARQKETPATLSSRPKIKRSLREKLEKYAFSYLSRYASSTETLKKKLIHQVSKIASERSSNCVDVNIIVNTIISRLTTLDLLNDQRFAERRILLSQRRGLSIRTITSLLLAKGLDISTIKSALKKVHDETNTTDLSSARQLLKRKKFGPGYDKKIREGDWKERGLAALARAGFNYQTAKEAIDLEASTDSKT